MKIAVYGDSITEGIGQRKVNYCGYLQEMLSSRGTEAEVHNFAHTGTTVRYLEEILSGSSERYDVSVISYGNVDGMLRPDTGHVPDYYKYIPSRYKQNGMLNPRPYYSSRVFVKALQHCDSFIRTTLNRLLLKLQGSTTWVSEAEFYEKYLNCVRRIKESGCKTVILLSTVHVKDAYFPGTNAEFVKFNSAIGEIAVRENCRFIDLFSRLNGPDPFYEDMYHPNAAGYRMIAELILKEIENYSDVET